MEAATATENATPMSQLEEAREELCGLKANRESFEDEKVMALKRGQGVYLLGADKGMAPREDRRMEPGAGVRAVQDGEDL